MKSKNLFLAVYTIGMTCAVTCQNSDMNNNNTSLVRRFGPQIALGVGSALLFRSIYNMFKSKETEKVDKSEPIFTDELTEQKNSLNPWLFKDLMCNAQTHCLKAAAAENKLQENFQQYVDTSRFQPLMTFHHQNSLNPNALIKANYHPYIHPQGSFVQSVVDTTKLQPLIMFYDQPYSLMTETLMNAKLQPDSQPQETLKRYVDNSKVQNSNKFHDKNSLKPKPLINTTTQSQDTFEQNKNTPEIQITSMSINQQLSLLPEVLGGQMCRSQMICKMAAGNEYYSHKLFKEANINKLIYNILTDSNNVYASYVRNACEYGIKNPSKCVEKYRCQPRQNNDRLSN